LFAIRSPHKNAVPVTVLLVGLPKKRAKLKTFNFIIQGDILSTGGDALTAGYSSNTGNNLGPKTAV
jgi:hypothetical protein